MNHHYKCDTLVDQFAQNGFITLQLWTKFTKADKWQFETNASVQQIHHENLIGYFNRDDQDAKLLKGDDKTPIKLVCKGQEFLCPRALLASQSAAFDAMFCHESRESQTGQIELEDSTPQAVEAMLVYLKTARIPGNIEEHVFDIVALAGRYLIDPLVRACENVMNSILSVENIVRILITIDQHHLNSELREIVTDYMKDNIGAIMKEPDWRLFMSEYPSLVNEFIMDLAEERRRLTEEVKEKREEQEAGDSDELSSDSDT
jgi:speckle-type POZ protein